MSIFLSLSLSFIFTWSYGLSLVQESNDIECKNPEVSVLIDKRDRFIDVTNLTDSKVEKYYSYEFLDSAILLQKTNSDEYAWIQITPQNTAVLIVGQKTAFTESNCKDTGASKTCSINHKTLFWSPTRLSFDDLYYGHPLVNMNVRHYGIYPNDGTYFLATGQNNMGLAIIDYGSKLDLIYGNVNILSCNYSNSSK